jgi:hypothetical protein
LGASEKHGAGISAGGGFDAGALASHVLIPYDRREAISLRIAAEIAGRSETTVRGWCGVHDIGRRVANGPW